MMVYRFWVGVRYATWKKGKREGEEAGDEGLVVGSVVGSVASCPLDVRFARCASGHDSCRSLLFGTDIAR